jgi:hypothetical protein
VVLDPRRDLVGGPAEQAVVLVGDLVERVVGISFWNMIVRPRSPFQITS